MASMRSNYTADIHAVHSLVRPWDNVSAPQTPFNATDRWIYDPTVLRGPLTIWFSLLLLFSAFGALSNGLLACSILRRRSLRTGCGILIVHLLGINFLQCTLLFPINGLLVYGKQFWFQIPFNYCPYFYYPLSVAVYVSNWTEAWLAWNRYIAIIHPHSYRNWVAPKACLVMITFSWAISVATMLPACFGEGGHFVASPGIGQCSLAPTSVVSYAFLSLSTYGPYVVVSLVLMRVVVRTITRRSPGLFTRSSQVCDVAGREIPLPVVTQPLIIQRRFNVALMLLVSFLFCVACNLPTYITLSFYQSLFLKYPLLTVWLRLSLVSQYAFSSLIFLAFNRDYRREVCLTLGWRNAHQQESRVLEETGNKTGTDPVNNNDAYLPYHRSERRK